MTRTMTFALLALFALALVPSAPADAGSCRAFATRGAVAIEAPSETLYVYAYESSWGSFVRAIYTEVWRETNGYPGLQTTSTPCGDGSVLPPDHRTAQAVVPDPSRIFCC